MFRLFGFRVSRNAAGAGTVIGVARLSVIALTLAPVAAAEPLTTGKPSVTLADPMRTQDDSFGNAAAQSGTDLIVGALDTTGDHGPGAAYIYTEDSSGLSKKPTAKLTGPNGHGCGNACYSVMLWRSQGTRPSSAHMAPPIPAVSYIGPYSGDAFVYVKGASG
jgi:hypothetical protein